jgi:hypothetical protein
MAAGSNEPPGRELNLQMHPHSHVQVITTQVDRVFSLRQEVGAGQMMARKVGSTGAVVTGVPGTRLA